MNEIIPTDSFKYTLCRPIQFSKPVVKFTPIESGVTMFLSQLLLAIEITFTCTHFRGSAASKTDNRQQRNIGICIKEFSFMLKEFFFCNI